MKLQRRILASALLAATALAIQPVQAGEEPSPNVFVLMCEHSADGKVSKEQVLKMVEKMFDKAEPRKEGKYDRRHAEFFHKQFTMESGS